MKTIGTETHDLAVSENNHYSEEAIIKFATLITETIKEAELYGVSDNVIVSKVCDICGRAITRSQSIIDG